MHNVTEEVRLLIVVPLIWLANYLCVFLTCLLHFYLLWICDLLTLCGPFCYSVHQSIWRCTLSCNFIVDNCSTAYGFTELFLNCVPLLSHSLILCFQFQPPLEISASLRMIVSPLEISWHSLTTLELMLFYLYHLVGVVGICFKFFLIASLFLSPWYRNGIFGWDFFSTMRMYCETCVSLYYDDVFGMSKWAGKN